jgi:phosphorylase kinase alpha/beta subunit
MLDLKIGLDALSVPEWGAIMAAPTPAYRAMWLRDQLYCTLAYHAIGDRPQAASCLRTVLFTVRKHRHKLSPVRRDRGPAFADFLHAKYSPALDEVTDDWGHHQLDMVGLLLHLIALMPETLTRDDEELPGGLVRYVERVRYADEPDIGMWEERLAFHSSSVGAVVDGLRAISVHVPVRPRLIEAGEVRLATLLPRESPDRPTDLALLSLVWPHRILTGGAACEVIERIERELVGENGVARYADDRYVEPGRWACGDERPEWPMGFEWLSICRSELGDRDAARAWHERGIANATADGHLPEICVNGKPNANTPLAWAHAMALIAEARLI